jgi:peptidyl-prolyl cis-trans isomerase B (cyclophilin B)
MFRVPALLAAAARTAVASALLVIAAASTGCAPDDRADQLDAIARWEDRRLAPLDSLATFMDGPDAVVRRAAVRAAGLIGRTDALPLMVHRLDDSSQSVAAQAAFSLGLLGGDVAVPYLATALDDRHATLRLAAVQGLAHQQHDGRVLLPVALGDDPQLASAAWTALRNVAASADHDSLVAAIRTALAHDDDEVRWRVLRCAERTADPSLVDQIAPYARDRNVQVRVHALRALGAQEQPGALAAVLDSGEHHGRLRADDRRRIEVAEVRALGKLAGPALAADDEGDHDSVAGRVAAQLIRAAQSADPHVAEVALAAMVSAVADIDVPAEAGQRESLLPVWRIRMARAAAQRLDDPSPAVRGQSAAALAALRRTGARDLVAPLLDDPDPTVSAAAMAALVAQADHAGRRRLFVRARDAHRDVWRAFLATLGPGDDAATADLALAAAVDGCADTDFTIRTTAAELLGRLPDPRGGAVLLAAWRDAGDLDEGAADVRLAVLASLEAWHGAVTAPDSVGAAAARVLHEAFDDDDLRVRLAGRRCAEATGWLPDALVPAEASLRETLPPVRRHAGQPAVAVPSRDRPRVRCVTDRGAFVIELDPRQAPNTSAAFMHLARTGFHDGLTFHRVVPDFVIQGGCPRGDGWGGPGWTIRSEWSRLPYRRGAVGIAHSGKDTGGSQWFVCHSDQPHLDGRYTVFGHVVEGLDVVDRIERGDVYRLVVDAP